MDHACRHGAWLPAALCTTSGRIPSGPFAIVIVGGLIADLFLSVIPAAG